jgi:hypothetical protein
VKGLYEIAKSSKDMSLVDISIRSEDADCLEVVTKEPGQFMAAAEPPHQVN